MKYSIYFSNSSQPHGTHDRACFAQTFWEAVAVYDALCRNYLHVTVFEALDSGDTKIIRRYINV